MGASIRTGRIEFINDTIAYLSPARRLQQDIIKAFVQNPTYINMKNVRMHITDEGLLIEFFNDPRHRVFADGQAELYDYGKLLICVTASKLASRGKASIIKIEVHGNVSQKFKPAEKDTDALSVSTARALNAYRLIQRGLKKTQFQKVSGFGKSNPSKDQPALDRVSVLVKIKLKK